MTKYQKRRTLIIWLPLMLSGAFVTMFNVYTDVGLAALMVTCVGILGLAGEIMGEGIKA